MHFQDRGNFLLKMRLEMFCKARTYAVDSKFLSRRRIVVDVGTIGPELIKQFRGIYQLLTKIRFPKWYGEDIWSDFPPHPINLGAVVR